MPNYIRPRVTGATVFFTVALADRGSDLLVREIGALRGAVAAVRGARWFGIDAWVVLPDHMHAVWTLPEGDRDFSGRWGAIKARFAMAMRRAGFTPPLPIGRRNGGVNPALRSLGDRVTGDGWGTVEAEGRCVRARTLRLLANFLMARQHD
jgi:putative transposase